MAQITQILLFLGKPVLKRSKITVWEWQLFKTAFAVKVLGICLPYVKRYFQEHQLSVFFFYGSNNTGSVIFRNATFGEI